MVKRWYLAQQVKMIIESSEDEDEAVCRVDAKFGDQGLDYLVDELGWDEEVVFG